MPAAPNISPTKAFIAYVASQNRAPAKTAGVDALFASLLVQEKYQLLTRLIITIAYNKRPTEQLDTTSLTKAEEVTTLLNDEGLKVAMEVAIELAVLGAQNPLHLTARIQVLAALVYAFKQQGLSTEGLSAAQNPTPLLQRSEFFGKPHSDNHSPIDLTWEFIQQTLDGTRDTPQPQTTENYSAPAELQHK